MYRKLKNILISKGYQIKEPRNADYTLYFQLDRTTEKSLENTSTYIYATDFSWDISIPSLQVVNSYDHILRISIKDNKSQKKVWESRTFASTTDIYRINEIIDCMIVAHLKHFCKNTPPQGIKDTHSKSSKEFKESSKIFQGQALHNNLY